MTGAMKKDARDLIPYCHDQGMPNLTGAGKSGVSVQHLSGWPMESGGVVKFADVGLKDMDVSVDKYSVFIQNHSDVADEGTVAASAKLSTQFTIVGPDVADVLDIMIVGTLKGQLK
jgi:hypothetical protein